MRNIEWSDSAWMRACELLAKAGKDGVLQPHLGEKLGMHSSLISKVAIHLEEMGLVRRIKVLDQGRWTYLLILRESANPTEALVNAPCIICPLESKCGVSEEVSPLTCPWIDMWVLKEHREIQVLR